MQKFRSIIFLGTGMLQRTALEEAINCGFYTVGVDANVNAAGKELCDKFFNLDSTNWKLVYNTVSNSDVPTPLLVWANNDILIKSRCMLESAFGINENMNWERCKIILNKQLFFEHCNDPLLVKNVNQKKITQEGKYIKKPILGSGSQGIELVLEESETNIDGLYIYQKYIDGTEYGLNCMVRDKKIKWYQTVKRFFDHSITFAPIGTSTLKENDKKINFAKEKLEKFIQKFQFYGPLKFDILITNKNQINLIEMSPRFHGEIDTSIVFSYHSEPIVKEYFGYFAKSNSMSLLSNKGYFGYFSLFKKMRNDEINRKKSFFFESQEVTILQIMRTNKNGSKNPKSTNDVYKYIFFHSRTEILTSDFIKFSKFLHDWK